MWQFMYVHRELSFWCPNQENYLRCVCFICHSNLSMGQCIIIDNKWNAHSIKCSLSHVFLWISGLLIDQQEAGRTRFLTEQSISSSEDCQIAWSSCTVWFSGLLVNSSCSDFNSTVRQGHKLLLCLKLSIYHQEQKNIRIKRILRGEINNSGDEMLL